jgi:hypothetical protein
MASSDTESSPIAAAAPKKLCPSCGRCHDVTATASTKKKDRSAYNWTAGLSTDCVTPLLIVERMRTLYANIASPTASQASDADLASAQLHKASLLYGEVQTAGVTRLFDAEHLAAHEAQRVCDLGMGCGRVIFQLAFQFPHLTSIVGIELATDRYKVCLQATERLLVKSEEAESDGDRAERVTYREPPTPTRTALEVGAGHTRVELHHGSLFGFPDKLATADIVLCNVDFPEDQRQAWLGFLTEHVRSGARLATYLCLEDIVAAVPSIVPRPDKDDGDNASAASVPSPPPSPPPSTHVPGWKRLEINSSGTSDRFLTSWSPKVGHHFFLYKRV